MSRFSDLVSKPARDMVDGFPASAPSQVRTGVQSPLIKLDSNENPFGPSRLAIKAMRSASSSSNFYPEDDCLELRRKLAARNALSIDQVLVTEGSTEMIALLCHTMLAPGLNAVTSECSFLIYDMAVRAVGAELRKAPLHGDGFDLAAIRAAINEDTRIVFLANPNNPTGTMVEAAAIDEFLADVPAHVVVVLDEAYYEYASHFSALRKVEYSRSLEYVRSSAQPGRAANFLQGSRLGRIARGIWLGPGRAAGLLRTHAQYVFGFVGCTDCGSGSARRSRPHPASGFEQCLASRVIDRRIIEAGFSCDPDFG